MKHYIKAGVISLFVLSIAVPAVASAAWYNPFSWFKKTTTPAPTVSNKPVPMQVVPINNPATTTVGTTTIKTDTGSVKSVPAKPVINKVPSVPKPIITKPASSTTTVKMSTSTGSTTSAGSTSSEIKVETAPFFVLNSAFTPAGFISPRSIKNGQLLLGAELARGDGDAIGRWYLDGVTWRIVSENLRAGDLTVSVMAGQSVVGDFSATNESITTKLTGHAVSDPIVFIINGQVPTRGTFKIVVEKVTGYMKGETTIKTFGGGALEGPEFKI